MPSEQLALLPDPPTFLSSFLLDEERKNLRPSTISQKRYALLRLARSIGGMHHLMDVTHEQLAAFVYRPSLGPEGQATEISHLRTFYKWAIREGYLDIDPTARLTRPKLHRRLPRPIPNNDLELALEMSPDRVRPMLYVAAYAGLRACEIAPLRSDHLHQEMDPPLLVVDKGKGGHTGVVPLAPALQVELKALPTAGWLFPRRDGHGGHIPPHLVSHLCNGYLHSIGISHTLHTLRHWFGTNTYKASGRDLRQTQELMRHQSPASTAIYTWVDPAEGANTVSALPVF